jgi:hypothetical protein
MTNVANDSWVNGGIDRTLNNTMLDYDSDDDDDAEDEPHSV